MEPSDEVVEGVKEFPDDKQAEHDEVFRPGEWTGNEAIIDEEGGNEHLEELC